MSLITIANEQLTVVVDTVGAGLHSVLFRDAEYLWQGDPTYWRRRDANLFPYVGRLTDGVYSYRGVNYPMTIHGFCIGREFSVTEQAADHVRLTITQGEDTLAMYPFRFAFHIDYTLVGNQIRKLYIAENHDDKVMPFGLGGHPGFQVPINGEGAFEDWYLEFGEPCAPERCGIHPESYRLVEETTPFPLVDDVRLPLEHSLFDNDAIVLGKVPGVVRIGSDKSDRSVTVDFTGTPFVGLWHKPHSDAPYVCIEPWMSLPSRHDRIEDLETQPHLIHLEPGKTYTNVMTVTLT